MHRALAIAALLLPLLPALNAPADSATPAWVPADEGFTHTVRAGNGARITTAIVHYPGSEPVKLDAERITESESGAFTIDVPPSPTGEPGIAALRLTLTDGTVADVDVAVSHYREIDITGPAAESLFTPLPTDDYLVDYIPCCNIYGGLLIAERIPVNPHNTAEGLPDNRLTDFVRLSPDGLTASTMGLYFEFAYESDLPADRIGLYEFGVDQWQEVFDYEVAPEKKRVRFHCPNGGTFVVAEKSATSSSPTD